MFNGSNREVRLKVNCQFYREGQSIPIFAARLKYMKTFDEMYCYFVGNAHKVLRTLLVNVFRIFFRIQHQKLSDPSIRDLEDGITKMGVSTVKPQPQPRLSLNDDEAFEEGTAKATKVRRRKKRSRSRLRSSQSSASSCYEDNTLRAEKAEGRQFLSTSSCEDDQRQQVKKDGKLGGM